MKWVSFEDKCQDGVFQFIIWSTCQMHCIAWIFFDPKYFASKSWKWWLESSSNFRWDAVMNDRMPRLRSLDYFSRKRSWRGNGGTLHSGLFCKNIFRFHNKKIDVHTSCSRPGARKVKLAAKRRARFLLYRLSLVDGKCPNFGTYVEANVGTFLWRIKSVPFSQIGGKTQHFAPRCSKCRNFLMAYKIGPFLSKWKQNTTFSTPCRSKCWNFTMTYKIGLFCSNWMQNTTF